MGDNAATMRASMKSPLLITAIVALAAGGVLRAQATFPPETDNAALRYWVALAEMREPENATRDLLGAAVAGRVPWDETKLGPFLDSNLDAVRTMQRATKLPVCNWGFDYRYGSWTPVWFVMQAKLLSQLNQLQGKREMAHGDSRAAVNAWLAGVHFAQDVSRGNPMIVAYVAHWMILDNLQPLRDSVRQGKLSEEEKEELSQVVKTMPKDGFDWGAAWGVEFAIGEQHLRGLWTARKPESEIRAYEEYMLAAQAALRQPPTEAKPQIDSLETMIRQLGQPEKSMWLSVRQSNDMRLRLAAMHEELAQALTSK